MKKQAPETHTCTQVENLTRIAEHNKQLHEVIYGNGKKGIREIVNNLSTQIETVVRDTESIREDVKVLVLFQTQIETQEKERGRHKDELTSLKKDVAGKQRWLVALIISTTLTLMGLIVAVVTLMQKIS